jgi:membrane peptidoglycan carboxypeptidase
VVVGLIQLLLAATVFVGAIGAGVAGLPGADAMVSQPLPDDTFVYDRTGTVLLADLHPPGYEHYQRPLSALGHWLPAATVAIEDQGFYDEPGVSPGAQDRAAAADLHARTVVQGGSTITQQLVKRQVVGDQVTPARKAQEIALAIRVWNDFTRDQVLEIYLNSVFYGNTAFGAQAAARNYFHRDAADLDLAQAALLAGLPQAPTQLDPLRAYPTAKHRQRAVLDAMVRAKAISRGDADEAFQEDLSPPDHIFEPVAAAPDGFQQYVADALARQLSEATLAKGGLHVLTTLDTDLQLLAQRAVQDGVTAGTVRGLSDGALVALDPRTGQVLALVGSAGPGTPGGNYDLAVGPPRNPGSSFKVFTYTAAIASRSFTMVTPVDDGPLTVTAPDTVAYSPTDGDLQVHPPCELRVCLGSSLNVPAVRVEVSVGVPAVVEQARRMGAPPFQQHGGRYTTNDPAPTFGPSLTLGGYGETPLQMATGVSVLAARGVLHEPQPILEVRSADGRRLFGTAGPGAQVVDPATAFVVSQMLADPANRTEIFGDDTPLALPGRHAAAKTGTAESHTDAWTIGYTPSLAAAIWMGNADATPMLPGVESDSMHVAAPFWHQFMSGALDELGRGDEWYAPPPGVVSQLSSGRDTYYLSGTEPSSGA